MRFAAHPSSSLPDHRPSPTTKHRQFYYFQSAPRTSTYHSSFITHCRFPHNTQDYDDPTNDADNIENLPSTNNNNPHPASSPSSPSFTPSLSWLSTKHDAEIISLAAPALLALAADPLMSIVDTAFVGSGGAEPLAALGICSALFTFSFLVFNFLATATTPLIATSLSSGDNERAGLVTTQGILIAISLGTVLAIALVLGADPALYLMGAGPSDQDISLAGGGGQVYSLARQFLVLRAAAAPATLLMSVGQGVFRGMKDMKTPLKITLWANALNFGLDGVLIVGLGWGVVGAGVATSVAEWVAAVAYLIALYEKREVLGAGGYGGVYGTVTGMITKLTRDDSIASSGDSNGTNKGGGKRELGTFVKAGTAVVLRTALLLGTKTAASATAARLGAVAMAGHQVTMQLWILSSFALDSFAVAGQALVAVEIGKRNENVAREIGDRLLVLGVGSGAVIAIVAAILQPGVIPGAFTDDRHVVDAAMEILPLATVMLPINAAVYVLDGILVGCADFKFLAVAMLGAAGVACGLLFNVVEPEGGLIGVWEALALLMVCRLISLVWRYQWRYGPLPPIQDDRN